LVWSKELLYYCPVKAITLHLKISKMKKDLVQTKVEINEQVKFNVIHERKVNVQDYLPAFFATGKSLRSSSFCNFIHQLTGAICLTEKKWNDMLTHHHEWCKG